MVYFLPSFRLAPESTRCGFTVIPAQAGIYALRFYRHSGASRNLRAAVLPSFRRKPESTRGGFSVIPAQAGIYALRFSRHSGASRNLRIAIFRHSGASRNLRVATASGFRRSDGSAPKPPARKHYHGRRQDGIIFPGRFNPRRRRRRKPRRAGDAPLWRLPATSRRDGLPTRPDVSA